MKSIKLISLDLDGTLLSSERKMLGKNREVLRWAKKYGCEIIISTGSPYYLIPQSELGGVDISYAITANGSAIYEYKTEKCIYEDSIDTKSILPILNFLLTKDMHIDIFIQGKAYCPSYTRAIVDKLDVPNARKKYILNNRVWLNDPLSFISEHQLSVQKITMNFYPDETGILVDRAEVKEELEKNDLLSVVSGGWGNLEITKYGVNKGCALKKICEIKHISPQSTIAIGDSVNDLDIVKTAGIGVAMSNSAPELIEAADYVTETNDECGVANAIKLFVSTL